ncbi:hypothetical protein GCM10010232_38470 [Streptomyces amakusaensis]
MAEVGLRRTEPQRAVVGAVLAVGVLERFEFDRVAEGRSGAVCLDRVHVGGGESGVGERRADDALLGGAVGGGEAVGRAVLVDRAAADDREDVVAVAARVGEPFDQQYADPLAPAGAVRLGGERLAPPVGGHPALLAELGERGRGGDHGDAADQCPAALAVAQRLDRQVEGDQRRGAGGVDGDGRAFQAEDVGEPAGQHAAGAAGQLIAHGGLGHPAHRVVPGR